MPAKKTPAPKSPAAKPSPEQCRYGDGSYGSPKSMARCKATRHPKRQLCDAHEAAWRVEAKRRAAAKKAAAPKSVQKRAAAKPLPAAYAARVLALEAEGMTTSDAQGAADVEFGLVSPAK
jgi:hypothetical protein